jgi:hypothetical protein
MGKGRTKREDQYTTFKNTSASTKVKENCNENQVATYDLKLSLMM